METKDTTDSGSSIDIRSVKSSTESSAETRIEEFTSEEDEEEAAKTQSDVGLLLLLMYAILFKSCASLTLQKFTTLLSRDEEAFSVARSLLQSKVPQILKQQSPIIRTSWSSDALRALILWIEGNQKIIPTPELKEMEGTLGVDFRFDVSSRLKQMKLTISKNLAFLNFQDQTSSADLLDEKTISQQELEEFERIFNEEMSSPDMSSLFQ